MIQTHDAGLTLIEMIVALALGALVVSFVAQGTGLLRAFAAVGETVGAQDETLAIRDHLRRTLESAMAGGSGPGRMVLSGVTDTAVFTVPGDPLLEGSGPVRVTLAAIPDQGHTSLVETRAAVRSGDPKTRTQRLVTGADHVSFSYYGVMSGDTKAFWGGEWTDPGSSPRLMRIDVQFPAGDRRRWPNFTALIPSGCTDPANPPNGETQPQQQPAAQLR